MKSSDIPHIGDTIRIFIHGDIGGGYYVARVINTSSPAEGEYYALVTIQRKFQDGKITPCDLVKKSMTIPLSVPDIWEFVKRGK